MKMRATYASINNYIRVCNRVYKLASNGEHGEDIERLLALGPEVIESTTITKVNCCYTPARITAEFIVCLIVRSWSILLLAQRNLDEHLITINDRTLDHLWSGATREKISKYRQCVHYILVCIRYARTFGNNRQIFPANIELELLLIDGCVYEVKILCFRNNYFIIRTNETRCYRYIVYFNIFDYGYDLYADCESILIKFCCGINNW